MQTGRSLVVALALLSLAILGLQTAAGRYGFISPLDRTVLFVFSPFERGFFSFGNWMGDLFHIGAVREEAQALRLENYLLKKKALSLQQVEAENRRLREALDFSETTLEKQISAEIISRDPADWFQRVTINRGRADGISANQGVIGAEGVVGKIAEAGEHVSRVMLLTDPNLAVPVEILPGGAQGILYGSGPEACVVKYLTRDAPVNPGDPVVTSGYGRLFGKGIPVGTVIRIDSESQTIFKLVRVKPAVEFYNLQAVYVLQR